MGERKVLNKYIPADFDPSLVPKGKKLSSKDGTVPVRMMLPFSVQCSTCHTFLYRGRKFNSKKEPMGGGASGKYLGITRWRFYIKCTHCSRPLTFLTDPKNADYEMESGGQRNYEMLKDKAATEQEAAEDLDEEEKIDPMKALENRVLESQQEMADLDNLEEIKAMNARHVKLLTAAAAGKGTNDQIIYGKTERDDEKDEIQLTAEDEALVKSIQFGKKAVVVGQIQRLTQDDERRVDEERNRIADELAERQKQLETVASSSPHKARPMIPIILKKKRRRTDDNDIGNKKPASSSATAPAAAPQVTNTSAAAAGLASLLGGYGSNSSDD